MSHRPIHSNEIPIVADKGQTVQSGLDSGNFARFSLRATIMFWFLAISLIPLVFVSLMGYHNAAQNRVEDFSRHLEAVSQTEKQDLKKHFQTLQTSLAKQAWNPQIMAMLNDSEAGSRDEVQFREGDRLLRAFQAESDARDIMLTDQQGKVVYSSASDDHRGMNLLLSEVVDPNLKNSCRVALDDFKPTFSGFKSRPNRGGMPLAYYVEPINGANGKTRGLLIMELSGNVLKMGFSRQNLTDLGTLSYVVDEDLQLLAASRKFTEIAQSENSITLPELVSWRHHLKLVDGVNHWENEFHKVREYTGIEGEDVLGIIQDLDVLGTKFALVSELPRAGVLAGLKRMGFSLLLVIVLVSVLVVLAGLLVSNRIVDPIRQLGHVMQRVSDGHEVWTLPENGPREVFQLSQMFHCMISRLTDAQEMNERQFALKRCQFELNEKLRGENSLDDISDAVLQYLGEYFNAQMGVFYLVESRDTYRMVARLGLPGDIDDAADIHLGQGLLGRVAAGKRIQILRGFREDRHKVETGLVSSFVNNLIVAPIHFGNRVLGVIELGLMENVQDDELEFLDLVSETIAVAINSARSRERVHRLLKETWTQAATLSKQQKDLRETNRRFELADQYKSEFLANMSHELRTPLNSLLIMSQVLAENRNRNLSREEVDSAMTINRAGSDLLLLINDILDLSKVDAGKLDIKFKSFDLKSLWMDMEDLFVPVAIKQGLEFRTLPGPELPEFMVSDPLRLTQVLKNILNNAFKFTDHGSVTFRMRIPSHGELAGQGLPEETPTIVFSVADTGVGMSSEVKKHIFEAFNQGDGSIGRRYGGSGLGLSISKKLSEMLGGHMDVQSIEGKGSTFSLYLALEPSVETIAGNEPEKLVPEAKISGEVGLSLEFGQEKALSLETLAVESSSTSRAQVPDLSSCRVLICEDDMRTVFQISEVLDDLGAHVTLAPSWAQAVAEGQADHGYDFAIISDRMADRPGSSSLQTWKQESGNPKYPVLALVLAEDGPLCEGADLIGSRPLVREEITGLIEQALAFEKTPVQQ